MIALFAMLTASSTAPLPADFDLADMPTVVAEREETERYLLPDLDAPDAAREPAKVRLRGRKVKLRLPLG